MQTSHHKNAGIGDISVTRIPRWWNKNVSQHPMRQLAALGVGGAVLGAAAPDAILKALIYLTNIRNPAKRKGLIDALNSSGTKGLTATRIALGTLLGGAGVAYTTAQHADPHGGTEGFFKSMTDPKYYQKNPQALQARTKSLEDFRKDIDNTFMEDPYQDGRRHKKIAAAFDAEAMFAKDRIPLSSAINFINEDPFLTLSQKDLTSGILQGAENSNTGLVSGASVARSAVHAGIGAGTGYLFGKVTGGIFSLPPPVTRRLSMAGAVAGAIFNTGVFNK